MAGIWLRILNNTLRLNPESSQVVPADGLRWHEMDLCFFEIRRNLANINIAWQQTAWTTNSCSSLKLI